MVPSVADAHRFSDRNATRLVKRLANKVRVVQPPIATATTRIESEFITAACLRPDEINYPSKRPRHYHKFYCIYSFALKEYAPDPLLDGDESIHIYRNCGTKQYRLRDSGNEFHRGVHVRVRQGKLRVTRFPIVCRLSKSWKRRPERYTRSTPVPVEKIPAVQKPPALQKSLPVPRGGAPTSPPPGPVRTDKSGVKRSSRGSTAKASIVTNIWAGADVFLGCTGWMQYPPDPRYWLNNCRWEPASYVGVGFGVSPGIFNHSVYSEWYYHSVSGAIMYWQGWT